MTTHTAKSKLTQTSVDLAAQRQSHAWFLARRGLGRTLIYLLLFAGSALYLFPFVWMLTTSLKGLDQVFIWPPEWFPRPLHFENYPEAWEILPFGTFT